METLISGDAIEKAAQLLQQGDVVAVPTETVYGLAADARRPDAVARIFEVKERPHFDPLIVHLPTLQWLEKVAIADEKLLGPLLERFWPGPLTVVLPRRSIIPDLVTSGLDTVAVRMSSHPMMHRLLEAFGAPLAAPSANRFGRISPTSASDVLEELGGRIPLILDGGPTSHGLESTIVRAAGETITILRSGPVTPEQLEEFGTVHFAGRTETVAAPGQLESHYAPRTRLTLLASAETFPAGRRDRAGLLAWKSATPGFGHTEVLSRRGDLREAAAGLFAAMRRLDAAGHDELVAEMVPHKGIGVAINDRLTRASAHV